MSFGAPHVPWEYMELTAEQLRQVIDVPDVEAQPVGDQRQTPRTRSDLQATLLPLSDRIATGPINVSLRDISRGGFGFFYHRPLPLGEHFALVLPQSGDRPLVILCTVAFWQPMAPYNYAIGARFSRVLRQAGSDLPLIFEDAITGELRDGRIAS